MIRSLLASCYGGKIDDEKDMMTLTTLINNVIIPEAYEEGFDVVKAVAMPGSHLGSFHTLSLPNGTTWDAFHLWVEKLPEREPPPYLGLPEDAEKLLLVEHGKEMLQNVGQVMRILDENEQVMAEES